MKQEKFPIPTLDSLIDNMNRAKYFSKIDLRNTYTHFQLSKQAHNFTAFITEEEVKHFLQLIYGLSPASAIFQPCLEQTLGGIKGVKFIRWYNNLFKNNWRTLWNFP